MTQTLVPLPHAGEVGATHLYLPAELKKEQFLDILGKLAHVGHGYWWWVADASMFGRHHFGPEILDEIARMVGCSRDYIEALANLAKLYPVRDRVLGLSITHHRSAARIESRAKRLALLQKAKAKKLTTTKVFELTRARDKRRVDFRFKVPERQANDPKFQAALKDFCKTWNITSFWRSGTRRHQLGNLLGGRRQALLG